MGTDVVHSRNGAAVHLVRPTRNTPLAEVFKIGFYGFGRIIGKEGIAYPHPVEFLEERYCVWEQGGTKVDGSIHIQCNVLNRAQSLFQLVSHSFR